MIQIIVNAFVEEGKETAVVEVLFASADHEKVKAKYQAHGDLHPGLKRFGCARSLFFNTGRSGHGQQPRRLRPPPQECAS